MLLWRREGDWKSAQRISARRASGRVFRANRTKCGPGWEQHLAESVKKFT